MRAVSGARWGPAALPQEERAPGRAVWAWAPAAPLVSAGPPPAFGVEAVSLRPAGALPQGQREEALVQGWGAWLRRVSSAPVWRRPVWPPVLPRPVWRLQVFSPAA